MDRSITCGSPARVVLKAGAARLRAGGGGVSRAGSQLAMVWYIMAGWIGLEMKSSMPASRQRTRSSLVAVAVMASTRRCASCGSARMWRVACKPSINGICTSISTQSNCV